MDSRKPSVVVDLEMLKILHCGLGQYSLHLGRSLLAETNGDVSPVFLMRDAQQSLFADQPVQFLSADSWRGSFLQRTMRRLRSPARRPAAWDLWHMTHQDSKFLPHDAATLLLLTIHDLNFLREKSRSSIRRRLPRLQAKINRATAITTGSEFSANEIRERFELRGKPIHVIPHGICIDPADSPGRRPAFLPDGPFLFTIGDVTAKKNFHVLVPLLQRMPEYRLVIAGMKSCSYALNLAKQINDAGLADRVILPGSVNDENRNWLYQNCEAFLFPSLSEGFGLPVVEAMSCGRPVFISRTTSLPEVGGPLAFYWNGFEAEAMEYVFRNGMRLVKNDAAYHDKLRDHAGQFSWSRAGQQYVSVYRSLLNASANRAA